MSVARKASRASTEVTWARWGMGLALVEILFDALGLAQQVRRVLVGHFDEFFHRLHGLLEFFGELGVLLVLPRVAQRRKPRLQRNDPILEVAIEPLQFLGETPHLFGIH